MVYRLLARTLCCGQPVLLSCAPVNRRRHLDQRSASTAAVRFRRPHIWVLSGGASELQMPVHRSVCLVGRNFESGHRSETEAGRSTLFPGASVQRPAKVGIDPFDQHGKFIHVASTAPVRGRRRARISLATIDRASSTPDLAVRHRQRSPRLQAIASVTSSSATGSGAHEQFPAAASNRSPDSPEVRWPPRVRSVKRLAAAVECPQTAANCTRSGHPSVESYSCAKVGSPRAGTADGMDRHHHLRSVGRSLPGGGRISATVRPNHCPTTTAAVAPISSTAVTVLRRAVRPANRQAKFRLMRLPRTL